MAHDQETNSKTPILDQPWSSVPEVARLDSILGSMSLTEGPPRGTNDRQDQASLPADRSRASEE